MNIYPLYVNNTYFIFITVNQVSNGELTESLLVHFK